MASVFNKKLQPACKYCKFSTELNFSDEIICKKRGISEPNAYCRSYKYDALKRQPERIIVKKDFTKDDFEI